MKVLLFILGVLVTQNFACLKTLDWWETAQFYQIYPRSFKDSNGDGIGDLNGIVDKIQHLKDIGVTATWLSPIYKSPMKDFGYDIADFRSIQDEYGTMDDFDALIKKANELGIKIIMDFVPNHSSDQHEWFKKSVAREKGYEDFYVWHDGYPDPTDPSKRLPPSNWLQAFRGSAWEWNEQRQQFYLHQFAVQQPDLNYRNPDVVQAMKDVLTFWLDKGVAGFRVDAVPWVFEIQPDSSGRYPDEPKSNGTDDPEESGYLLHIYTLDQPETVDMVYQWRALLDNYKKQNGGDTRVLLTETYSALNYVMEFYGNGTAKGAEIPFNFNFITRANNQSNAFDLINVIDLWLSQMPTGQVANWVMGNHDQRRVGSRYGQQRIDTMNMINLMLPGVSITYNGEEIGMLDGNLTWEESVDPAACNSNPEIFQKFTRDPERTPFQWDDTTNAGFSTAESTWLPVNPNYKEINVQTQSKASRSHLTIYKELSELRRTNILKYGKLQYKAISDNVLVIARTFAQQSLILAANIGPKTETIDLSSVTNVFSTLTVKIASVSSKKKQKDTIIATKIALDPYESVIIG